MRRTFGLAVAVCALVGAAGVAGVSLAETQSAQRRPGIQPVTTAPQDAVRNLARIGTVENATGAIERRGKFVGANRTLTYRYPGASYVKLHFSRALLRPGDSLVVSDPAGTESYTYTAEDLQRDPWAMSITGDTATVRLEQGGYDPLGLRTRLAGLGVTVDKVARGFREATQDEAPEGPTQKRNRTESICGGTDEKLDAVCYRASHPTQYQRAKAVARVLINGVELCTAWRVGPNNRLLTNNHCASNGADVRRSEVWFNYECAQCNGFDVVRTTKVWGDQLLANGDTLDYALFTVRNFDAVSRFGYLEIDNSQPRSGQELYIPQHPRGLPMMIAMEDPGERDGSCAIDDPTYYGYDQGTDVSYFCDTDGGSSGSPVISATTHKVVALHHFGGCPNSGVRMDLINREIGRLL
jgi:lysyl endopeptidase